MVLGMVVGVLLAAGPAKAATQPGAPAAAKAQARPRAIRIAVLDVQASGAGDRKTVEGLSSLLASEVARRPELSVVAGSDLRALIGFERQKQLLGCTEASCLTEIAGALGVSYLVSSECSKVGSTWLLSLSLLDAGKAVALKRLTRRAYSDDSLVDEASAAVDELLTALPGVAPLPPRLAPRPAAAPVAQEAPPAGPPTGYHTHDGFFLGLNLGLGGMRSSVLDLTISGVTGTFAVALGGSVTDSLAVYVQVFDEVNSSPTFKDSTGSLTASNVTHSLVAYGLGAAWYGRSNYFVAATAALGQVGLEWNEPGVGAVQANSKWGPAFRLSFGKEWWVSTDWGLGLAVNLTGASNKNGDATATITSGAASLTFSATYN